MKKDLGSIPAVFPMPVLMIGTYDEEDRIDVMNAAWGQICDYDKIILSLTETHKTTANIKLHKAFTVALADEAHMKEADYFGMVSANQKADKFNKTGFHAVRSAHVHAPVIEEFPLVMECELFEIIDTDSIYGIVGRIVNVSANEEVLDDEGKVDVKKLNALIFDQFRHGYYTVGEKAGQGFSIGKQLLKE